MDWRRKGYEATGRDQRGRLAAAGPPEARFWPKVRKTPDCWIWEGGRSSNGYGAFWDGARQVCAHQFAYASLVGPLDPNLTIDHLCRNRACVNPDHLEQITQRENVLRGDTLPAAQMRKTRCIRGHPFSPENTYWNGRERRCRTCQREHERAHYRRKAAASR